MAELIFWASVFLMFYTYLGYPWVLVILTSFKKHLPTSGDKQHSWPAVSILIAAHNEEKVIRERIENLLAVDYPRECLEIFIVSDASSDRTNRIVEEYTNRGVTFLAKRNRGGKTAALNAACPRARGDIFLFTDANGILNPDAVKKLVRHFDRPDVGCVSGAVHYFDPANGAAHQGESCYMRYDAWVKKLEGALGSLVGAYGGNFAFHRRFFEPMDPMVPVDLEIPLRVLQQGYQVIYEPSAVSLEPASPRVGIEFARHARISARTFYCLGRWLGYCLHPLRPFFLFQFVSKKVLRWVSPFLLLNLLLLPFLIDGGLFALLRLGAGVLAISAGGGALLYWTGKPRPPFSYAFHFVVGNAAVAWGLVSLLSGRQGATWSVVRGS